MKSVIKKGKEYGYPCLKVSYTTDTVVLFEDDSKGMVVFAGSGINPIGHYDYSWDMDSFAIFNGGISLEN